MATETVSFYAELPYVCLARASLNLGVLHLSADTFEAWCPTAVSREIYIRCAEDLMLFRFNFSQAWQVRWLSGHTGQSKAPETHRMYDTTLRPQDQGVIARVPRLAERLPGTVFKSRGFAILENNGFGTPRQMKSLSRGYSLSVCMLLIM